MYQVFYVNWRGEWVSEPKYYAVQSKAQSRAQIVAKEKALNGRIAVQLIGKVK